MNYLLLMSVKAFGKELLQHSLHMTNDEGEKEMLLRYNFIISDMDKRGKNAVPMKRDIPVCQGLSTHLLLCVLGFHGWHSCL